MSYRLCPECQQRKYINCAHTLEDGTNCATLQAFLDSEDD